MSIASEINRIKKNITDSLSAVADKGVTIPTGSKSDDLPGLIAQILQGEGSAVVVTEQEDEHGGVVKIITAVDLSDDTVRPGVLLQGYTAHNRLGQVVVGTATSTESPAELQIKTVQPMKVSQTVTPDEGYDGLSEVRISGYTEFEPSGSINITENGTVNVHDYEEANINVVPDTQVKTATPSSEQQVLMPDPEYDALAAVVLEPIPEEYVIPSGTKSITANGTTSVSGYANASVNVQPSLQGKTVTPTKNQQSISPDSGYYGLSGVTVNAIPSQYIVPDGVISITSNGTQNVTNFSSAEVNVQPSLQSKTVTPTTSQQTVSPNSGYYGLSSVTVSAIPSQYIVPSGTKIITENGTVDVTSYSNAQVNVNPSVQDKTVTPTRAEQTVEADSGYYALNSVTVGGIPAQYVVPSGTKTITENGTNINVGQYAMVDVNVVGVGSVTQDEQGYLVLDDDMGGETTPRPDTVKFYDYDGTLVASYAYIPEELPAVPTHSGLKNGTWNYTLEQIAAQFYESGGCDIGANYSTASGKTEIDVVFDDAAALSPYIQLAPDGTVIVDWGDGSETDSLTGTSLTTIQYVQHTYTNTGSYTITIEADVGTYSMCGANSFGGVLTARRTTLSLNSIYTRCVRAVRIGDSCTELGPYAFSYCNSLSSITIPSSVTSIRAYAFSRCYSLSSVSIPSSVTSVMADAFSYCYSLSSVAIPSSVTSIAGYMFNYCYSLSSITIPSGVTRIGDYAFNNCYPLSSITIPSGVTYIGDSAFSNCYLLSSITIPSGVTYIGKSAFSGCRSLSSITIPSSVTSIGKSVFSGCRSLSSITISSSVTSIGDYAFNNCYSLSSITIPSSVTSIGNSAFAYCYSLSSITIPSGVTSIGDNAFNYCSSLSSITIPSSVTSIGNSAFAYCDSLSSITIQSSVTSIGRSAFSYCYSLSSITIPSSVTSIGDYAFSNCSSLSSITIPSGVTSIGMCAFSYCSSLFSITIPSGVTSIGESTFGGCSSLSSITIPSGVTSVGASAFSACGAVEYHFMSESVPQLLNINAFNGIGITKSIIYVPKSENQAVLNAYKEATNWSTYASYMREEAA